MEIREVMTSSVVTAAPDCPVRRVAELMRERNVGSVVLVSADGDPVGFVTDRDLAVSVLAEGRDPEEAVEGHASAPVITGEAGMGLEEAAELMVEHGIRRLPVCDGPRMVGILTLDDLAARTQDPQLVHRFASRVTRAAMPGFYFHDRGG